MSVLGANWPGTRSYWLMYVCRLPEMRLFSMLGYPVVAFNRPSKRCNLNNNPHLRSLPADYEPNELPPLGLVNDKSVPLLCYLC